LEWELEKDEEEQKMRRMRKRRRQETSECTKKPRGVVKGLRLAER